VSGIFLPHERVASVSDTAAVVALRLHSSRLSAYASLFRPPNRRPKQMSQFHVNCLARIHKLVLKHHFQVKFTTSKMDKENYRIIFTK